MVAFLKATLFIWIFARSPPRTKGQATGAIVSKDIFNYVNNLAYVCPITTRNRHYPFHVPLDGRTRTTGVIMVDQLRSADLGVRNAEYAEKAPKDIILKVVDLIRKITESGSF